MSMEGSNVNSNKGDAYQDKDWTIRISNHGQSIQSFIVLGGRYNIFIKNTWVHISRTLIKKSLQHL